MSFKSIIASSLAGAALLLASAGASAQIAGSLHDLSGLTSNNDQVCVFCHTPHGADTGAAVPLWNKVLPAPGTFTMYSTLNTVSLDGTEANVGSVSLACLSCHDGTQARDVVINAPGSGGYNPAGAPIETVGIMTGTPVPVLGTDLTDDHPISIQYAGGGAISSDGDGLFGGTLGDGDFNAPFKGSINAQPQWWVNSIVGATTAREKVDMLLYARSDLGVTEPFVECGSCHDPHNSSTAGAGSVAFLRMTNDASQICTTCHIK